MKFEEEFGGRRKVHFGEEEDENEEEEGKNGVSRKK